MLYTGELPIAVDVQTFGTGFHSVTIVVVDSIGFTAETTVVYELEMESCKPFYNYSAE